MNGSIKLGAPWWAACAAWGLVALAPSIAAAESQQIAYYPGDWGYTGAHLVTWDVAPGKAAELNPDGKATGTYVSEGATRTLTYSKPWVFENYSYHFDSCNVQVPTTLTRTRIRFRLVSGTPEQGRTVITQDAQQVVDSGCDQGLVLWSTKVDDPDDYGWDHVLMAQRQGQAGLRAGDQLAGLQAGVLSPGGDNYLVPDELVTLLSGGWMAFADTGASYRYRTDAEGWWVLDLPWGQRAYTRLQSDGQGGQNWLMADVVKGKKQWVQKALVASAKPGSRFASVEAAARVWESGFSLVYPDPFFAYLYADGSGLRGSPGYFSPLTWSLQSGKVVQDIPYRASSGYKRYRTWQSVQKVGDVRWVLEDDRIVNPDGTEQVFIGKRLHPQVDRGVAAPTNTERPIAHGGAHRSALRQDGLRSLLKP